MSGELFIFVGLPVAVAVLCGAMLLVHNWANDRAYARLSVSTGEKAVAPNDGQPAAIRSAPVEAEQEAQAPAVMAAAHAVFSVGRHWEGQPIATESILGRRDAQFMHWLTTKPVASQLDSFTGTVANVPLDLLVGPFFDEEYWENLGAWRQVAADQLPPNHGHKYWFNGLEYVVMRPRQPLFGPEGEVLKLSEPTSPGKPSKL